MKSQPDTQPDRPVNHLPNPEGWKAKLTKVVGYRWRWFTCPQAVNAPIQVLTSWKQPDWKQNPPS